MRLKDGRKAKGLSELRVRRSARCGFQTQCTALLAGGLICACATSNFTKTGFARQAPPRGWPCDIAIFMDPPKDRPIEELGFCDASVPGGGVISDKTSDATEELRKCACGAGGNAIVLRGSDSTGFQSAFGYSQQRVTARASVLVIGPVTPAPPAVPIAVQQTREPIRKVAPAKFEIVGEEYTEKRVLAVLELRNKTKAPDSVDPQYLSDVIRAAVVDASPGMKVVTRENLLVLLAAGGKQLEECEGECEVDTGRRIGADLVISGEVLRVGSQLKVNLRLHDTHEGRLVAGIQASAESVEALDARTTEATRGLLSALHR